MLVVEDGGRNRPAANGWNENSVTSRLQRGVAPGYIIACLVLGGSAQGIWQNMVLQLLGIAMIAWVARQPGPEGATLPARRLLLLAMASVALVVLQLIPLPPTIWSNGIRGRIIGDYHLLGEHPRWIPLSLTPAGSLDAVLKLIPPLAVFSWMTCRRPQRSELIAAALLIGTIAGIVIGALQLAGGESSSWYFYERTNVGFAVGFFANANHMADLLVISLPFVAALIASARHQDMHWKAGSTLWLSAVALLILAGIAINHSIAALGLSVPVAFASAVIVFPQRSPWQRLFVILAGLSVIFSLGALYASSVGATKVGQDARTSVDSRAEILASTGRAIGDFMPLGSGLGSFVKVYPLYEQADKVTTEYVIHAHDDYAELALELGVPGIILMFLFLLWWAIAVLDVWGHGRGGPFERAASVASGVVLVHSLVDYPLRTAAISACFAAFMAILATRRRSILREDDQLRPVRHIIIR